MVTDGPPRFISLVLAATLLAGCSAPAAPPPSNLPKTCEHYASLPAAEREDLAIELAPAAVGHFSDDEAHLVDPVDWFDDRCSESSPTDTLRSLADPTFPTCDSYLQRSPDVQLTWSTVFWKVWRATNGWTPLLGDERDMAVLARACEATVTESGTYFSLNEVAQFLEARSTVDPAGYQALVNGDPPPAPPAALASLTETFPITDADGYTMNVAIAYQPIEYVSNPASEKPGFTAITSRFKLTVTVSNTTPSRDIKFAGLNGTLAEPVVNFFAVFAAGNPVCTSVGKPGACAYLISSGELNRTIPAGGSAAAGMVRGSLYGIEPGVAHVPEEQAEAVLAAIAQPDGYRLSYAADDFRRFPEMCAITGTVGGFIATGICDEAAQLKQPGQY